MNRVIFNDGETAHILISNRYVCLIDAKDYDTVRVFRWRHTFNHGNIYVVTKIPNDQTGRPTTLSLHRYILGIRDPQTVVDHIDLDGLNNRRSNLRICTIAQNCRNHRNYKSNTAGYSGVCQSKGRFRSRIKFNGQRISLGQYDTAEEAARAYNEAAIRYFGEFARLNEIPGGRS